MKRIRLASLSVALIVALSVVGAAVLLLPKSPGSGLPNSCSEPTGGFLIIASKLGFNDSVNHGVPASSWPVVSVKQGQQVDIVVCNTDIEAHGFQIARYYDNSIVSLAPGQVIHVSFVANQAGSFRIYCSIFCSIHAFMQSGLLRVSP